MLREFLFLAMGFAAAGLGFSQVITTVAGTTFTFLSPLPALNAPLGQVTGVAVDGNGNVYVADPDNNLVLRFIPGGQITVVAGDGIAGFSGDAGPAANASLNGPQGVAVDSVGNLYIADQFNGRIRKVSGGTITTVAGGGTILGDGGPATGASLSIPSGVAVDSNGNLYIADFGNQRIRKVSGGTISTVAGNGTKGFAGDGGPAASAALNYPKGVALDSAGSLYIADQINSRIRKVSGGTITTVAGGGQIGITGDGGVATSASLQTPSGVAVDSAGNLYIAESSRIRKVSNGLITTVAGGGFSVSGDGGSATSAFLNLPNGVAIDSAGTLYIAEAGNSRIRKVSGRTITTVAGNGAFKFAGDGGPATSAALHSPGALAVDSSGKLYMADTGNNRIRQVSGGAITTVAGNGTVAFSNDIGDGGPATDAPLYSPRGVAVDAAGNLYFADQIYNRIRKVSGGIITTVAGNGTNGFSGDGGPATGASLNLPSGVAIDAAGNLYIADQSNNRIRKVSGGTISTVAGNGTAGFSGDGGAATSATLNSPKGVFVDSTGNLYIADSSNNRIRKVAGGTITTIAGGGTVLGDGGPATGATLSIPAGVAVDSAGNLYIADSGSARVRKVSNGTITTVAGGKVGFSGDGGPATSAALNNPNGVAIDSSGSVYIVDTNNDRVRKVLSSAPSLSVSNTQITIPGVTQGIATQSNVAVTSSAQGIVYSAKATTATGGNWLSVASAQGTAPGVVTILADPGSLQPGNYQGTVTITSPNASPNSLSVAVTFQVGGTATTGLLLQTLSLSFPFTAGNGPSNQQFSVSNQGSGIASFTALAATTTGGTWLTVSPASASVSNTAPAYITVTATPGKLSAGTYSGSITFSSPDTKESITVPVTMSISAAQQKILLSQTGLNFNAVAQAGPPLPQNFGILNQGQGTLNWTASSSTLSGGAWLSIDVNSGTVTRPLLDVSLVNVNIDSSALAPGDYYGMIQVKAVGAANSPQAISVKLSVLPPGSNPGPELRPTGVIFIGTQGNNPSSQNVMVSNPGSTPVDFGSSATYLAGGGWLQYRPSNATVGSGSPVKLILQPDLTTLQVGVQRAAVTLVFADGSIRTVAVLNVVAPTATSGNKPEDRTASGCTTVLVHPTTLTDTTNTVTVGQPVRLGISVADNCGNAITTSSGSAGATFSNGDTGISMVHVGNGNWSGTWTPSSRTQGRVTIQYSAFAVAGFNIVAGSASVPVTVLSGSTPQTFAATNAASGAGTFVSPGGLVSIYGMNLAGSNGGATTATLPTQVGDTQVLIGGTPVPLRYVSGGQVNAQIPFELGINTGQQIVVQRGNTLSVPQDILVAAAQPAIYTQNGTSVILDPRTNALITSANPAKAGDTVVIYCNGLGAVSPQVASGTPAPSQEPLARTMNTLTAVIGNIPATVNYAGLAPGFPDLYQVNLVVPAGVAPGSAAVVLTIAGQSSPPVALPVQ